MFEIDYAENGAVSCSGRLDAAQSAKAEAFLGRLDASQTLDFEHLEYISSAGLAILLKTQKSHWTPQWSQFAFSWLVEAALC